MLTWLRMAAGTWVAKLLLIMLVLSFAVWGISGQITSGIGSNVLTAGDTRVSVTEYRLAYDRQLSLLSQQLGTQITREQAQAFGVDNQVLSQLVAGAVLDEQAREMRLGLSRDRLAVLTAEDPAFQGPDGRFNRAQFEWVLRQIGMRAEDYLKSREQVAIRQQIVEAVSDGIVAPDTFLRAVSLYQGEDRTVEYLVLPRALVEPVEEPSSDTLSAWFEERKAGYGAPEYRRIAYVKLEPEDIADPAAVSDEEVRAFYEQHIDRFTTAERRAIDQLVFADEAAARAALDKVRGGASFDDIVAGEGKTPGDVRLGTFDRQAIADQAIAEAAFALQAGEVSEVVAGTFGPVLLRVAEIEPEVVKPLAEAAQDIRHDIALDDAHRIIVNVYDSYEDARAAGSSMVEAAAQQRLSMVTVEAVDRSGRTPGGTILTDLPLSDELLNEAFDAEVGVENAPLNIGSSGYLFYEVEGITPARERPLDEVREEVLADWIAVETATRLAARAAEIEKELADGRPMAEIADELGLQVETRRGLKRDANDAGLGDAGVAAAFSVGRGDTGVVSGPDGQSQIVFSIAEVIPPAGAGPDAVPEALRDNFATGLGNDLLDQLVIRLQTQYPVTVNQGAIQQALSF